MKKYVVPLLVFWAFFCTPLSAESEELEFSEGELEQILAPIALYPDSVLTHILIASTYPLEIIQAERFAQANPDLKPAEALEKVENKDWDPSVKALVPFPQILERMSKNLDWTQKLGDAFLQQEDRTLDAIQRLRQRAHKAGSLDKMDNVEVVYEAEDIIIQPIKTEVIYIPYYDTRVVYGHWYHDLYPPVYWDWDWHHHPYYGHTYRPHASLFSWHPGFHFSVNYHWGAFHWHNRHVVLINDYHYRPRTVVTRHHIINSNNSRRWSHNPSHRHGVAYRTNVVRDRYQSNRPSLQETRVVRHGENRALTSRSSTQLNNKATVSSSVKNSNREKSELSRVSVKENQSVKEVREPGAVSSGVKTTESKSSTRQEKLRNSLDVKTKEASSSLIKTSQIKATPQLDKNDPSLRKDDKTSGAKSPQVNQGTSKSKSDSSNNTVKRNSREKDDNPRKSSSSSIRSDSKSTSHASRKVESSRNRKDDRKST